MAAAPRRHRVVRERAAHRAPRHRPERVRPGAGAPRGRIAGAGRRAPRPRAGQPAAAGRETCELAGFGDGAEIDADLVEWDYGELEGLTDAQTRARLGDWDLFRDGAPGGESPADVQRRVERAIARVRTLDGVCLLVGHGKLLRALAARWIDAELTLAGALALDPAGVSLLQREGEQPLLRLWNYAGRSS